MIPNFVFVKYYLFVSFGINYLKGLGAKIKNFAVQFVVDNFIQFV